MGLDSNGTTFLLYARQKGVSFIETATIGRQSLLLNSAALLKNFRRFGNDISHSEAESILSDSEGYADGFLARLGARNVTSFDGSQYEGATVAHDFNIPIGREYTDRFSVVLDGGTLEHIFNYPIALKNCMEMVKCGGHFLAITPANNFLGHGFYQFSPELFFRVFSAPNGFKIEKALIFEDKPDPEWYEITDPEAANERVTLTNGSPAYLLVIAKKTEVREVFSAFPQQSDYSAIWKAGNGYKSNSTVRGNIFSRLLGLPNSIVRRTRRRLVEAASDLGRNPDHFKKIDPYRD